MKSAKAIYACGAVALSMAAIGLASPASGQSPTILVKQAPDLVVRTVAYDDLNLTTPAAQHALVGRVRVALTDLCGEIVGSRDGYWMSQTYFDSCRHAGWSQAQPQINRAVQRAREISMTGKSTIAASAVTIAITADRH